jgi:DNA repair protein REV1
MSTEAEHGSLSDDTTCSTTPYTVKDVTHISEQDGAEKDEQKTGIKNGTKRVLEGQQDDFNWDDHRSYMSVKKRKLADQFHGMAGKKESMIFEGVTVYVNGWTEPSNDELKRMIHAHGGSYVYNLYGNTKVTHTIASNLPNSKIKTLGDSVVCTPAWIVDSITAGHQLPTDDYLLYKNHGSQKKLSFSKSTSTLLGDQSKKGEQNIDSLSSSLSSTNTNVHHQETSQHSDGKDGDHAGSGSTSSDVKAVEQASATGLPVARTNKTYKSSKGAEFVNEFFTHSRLHYLSTWSTELKQFTARMVNRIRPKYPKLDPSQSLRRQHQRAVVHIDLDCFFVSVSIRDKPHLKGKPVAVTHAKAHSSPENATGTVAQSSASSDHLPVKHLQDSTSDIASCSYEARKAGVHNGMSVGKAVKLCPDLELLPYDFDGYRQVSQIFYETLLLYSSTVEAVSCDEAYLELTDYAKDFSRVETIIGELRGEVEMKTGCTVSAGISHNMLLARLSTRKAKPNGQFYLSNDHAEEFLGSLSVHDLPGVGHSTANKLKEMNVEICGELSSLSLAKLQKDFGLKNGTVLYEYSRGIDSRELKVSSERKSVSVDINYGIRFTDISEAESLIKNLADELAKRAKEAEVAGGNVTLKMKIRKPDVPHETWKYLGHGICDNFSRSTLLLQPTQDAKEISQFAVKLLKQVKVVASDIRGMGLQLSKLVSTQTDSTAARGSSSEGANLRKLFQAAASSAPPQADTAHG